MKGLWNGKVVREVVYGMVLQGDSSAELCGSRNEDYSSPGHTKAKRHSTNEVLALPTRKRRVLRIL